jgi:hypothetical protein
MRRVCAVPVLGLALALALAAPGYAGTTPVLSVQAQTLHWTGSTTGRYVVERKPGPTFAQVTGTSYKPAPNPGHTDAFRVRPYGSPNHWSNEVTITYVPENEKEKEKEAPRNTLGRVRVAPDTAEWDSYENATWAPWVKEHIAYLRLYPGTGRAWLNLGVPTESYRDWPAGWEGTYAPLTPERRTAFINSKSAADKAGGYGGNFLDDLNGWASSTLSYRDNLQNKSSLEPEAAEQGRLTAQERAYWGPSGVLDCNTQMWDALAAIRAGSVAFAEDLTACSIQTKEFGVSPTSGITTASAWQSFLEWVAVVHAHHAQVRMTGSIPVSEASFQLNEATYFLITEDVSSFHGDLLWMSKQLPASSCNTAPVERGWFCGLNVNLGEALGPRERMANGVWRRRFSAGEALVNEPGNAMQTLSVGGKHTIRGEAVSQVTLAGDNGVVLLP